MNTHATFAPTVAAKTSIAHSVCPHDCPSACALDVEIVGPNRIGRVHGAKDNTYTAGVICAKVARYADRIHHPDRLRRRSDSAQAPADSWSGIGSGRIRTGNHTHQGALCARSAR